MLRLSSSGRAPDLDPALNPLHDLDQYHARGDNGEHSDEDPIGLEARASLVDHGAEPRGRAVDFTDDHADHPAADRKPQSRQQKRNRTRQDDGLKQLPLAGAESYTDLDQARIGGAHCGMGVDRYREYLEQ